MLSPTPLNALVRHCEGPSLTGMHAQRAPSRPSLLPSLISSCSQTIFTMRAGVFSRWNGVVVALSEYIMFALPFPGGCC